MKKRELSIFMNSGILSEPANFIKFARKIEEKINANDEILKSVKSSNQQLFEYIQNIVVDPENANFCGSMIEREIYNHIPVEYDYADNFIYDGVEYVATIDMLKREFTLAKKWY